MKKGTLMLVLLITTAMCANATLYESFTLDDIRHVVREELEKSNNNLTKDISTTDLNQINSIHGDLKSQLDPIFQIVDSTNKRVSILKDRTPATTEELNASVQQVINSVVSKKDLERVQLDINKNYLLSQEQNDRLRMEVIFLMVFCVTAVFCADAWLRHKESKKLPKAPYILSDKAGQDRIKQSILKRKTKVVRNNGNKTN